MEDKTGLQDIYKQFKKVGLLLKDVNKDISSLKTLVGFEEKDLDDSTSRSGDDSSLPMTSHHDDTSPYLADTESMTSYTGVDSESVHQRLTKSYSLDDLTTDSRKDRFLNKDLYDVTQPSTNPQLLVAMTSDSGAIYSNQNTRRSCNLHRSRSDCQPVVRPSSYYRVMTSAKRQCLRHQNLPYHKPSSRLHRMQKRFNESLSDETHCMTSSKDFKSCFRSKSVESQKNASFEARSVPSIENKSESDITADVSSFEVHQNVDEVTEKKKKLQRLQRLMVAHGNNTQPLDGKYKKALEHATKLLQKSCSPKKVVAEEISPIATKGLQVTGCHRNRRIDNFSDGRQDVNLINENASGDSTMKTLKLKPKPKKRILSLIQKAGCRSQLTSTPKPLFQSNLKTFVEMSPMKSRYSLSLLESIKFSGRKWKKHFFVNSVVLDESTNNQFAKCSSSSTCSFRNYKLNRLFSSILSKNSSLLMKDIFSKAQTSLKQISKHFFTFLKAPHDLTILSKDINNTSLIYHIFLCYILHLIFIVLCFFVFWFFESDYQFSDFMFHFESFLKDSITLQRVTAQSPKI